MSTRFRAGSATHVGQVRSSNQDSFHVGEDLFVVADGMGGHSGGEVASQVAVQVLTDGFAVPTTDALVDAVQAANEAVLARAEAEPELRGMGTTLVALAAVVSDGEDRLAIVNVGDSRCYLLDGDALRQITSDHSVVQVLVDNGQITPAEAETHPQRNVLTRALGIESRVMADSWELLPFAGDRYLLCSDGLFNEVTGPDITTVLREDPNPGDAAARLVDMANDGGGRDNITVVIVDVMEDGGRRAEADAALARVAQYTPAGKRAIAAAAGDAGPEQPGVGEPAGGTPTAGGVATAAASPSVAAAGAPTDAGVEEHHGPGFRSIAFVGVVIAVVLTAVGVVVFASRGTYFVAFDDNLLTIYQGRPGGFLGMQPSVEERTTVRRADIPASYLDEIEGEREFSDLDAAHDYIRRIEEEITRQRATPVPTFPTDTSSDTSSPPIDMEGPSVSAPTTTAEDGSEDTSGDSSGDSSGDTTDGDGTDAGDGEPVAPTTADDGFGSGGIGGNRRVAHP